MKFNQLALTGLTGCTDSRVILNLDAKRQEVTFMFIEEDPSVEYPNEFNLANGFGKLLYAAVEQHINNLEHNVQWVL